MLGCGSHSLFTVCWVLGYVLFIFKLEVLGKQRQENYSKLNTNLNYSERPCFKKSLGLTGCFPWAPHRGVVRTTFLWSLRVLLGSGMQGYSVSVVL